MTILITFDRLTAASLGCYGCFAVETSAWDLLAAQGIVFDHCYVPAREAEAAKTCLLPDVGGVRITISIHSVRSVQRGLNEIRSLLRQKTATVIECCIVTAVDPLEQIDDRNERLKQHLDKIQRTDEILGKLLEVIATDDGTADLVVTAMTGEAEAVRAQYPAWLVPHCEEATHVPLIVVPGKEIALRSVRLMSDADRLDLLQVVCQPGGAASRDWLAESLAQPTPKRILQLVSPVSESIRTAHWVAIKPTQAAQLAELEISLFAIPEDRWFQLNLAPQYPAVVEELERLAGWN